MECATFRFDESSEAGTMDSSVVAQLGNGHM